MITIVTTVSVYTVAILNLNLRCQFDFPLQGSTILLRLFRCFALTPQTIACEWTVRYFYHLLIPAPPASCNTPRHTDRRCLYHLTNIQLSLLRFHSTLSLISLGRISSVHLVLPLPVPSFFCIPPAAIIGMHQPTEPSSF